jgi:predicted Zn-dependent peptidase
MNLREGKHWAYGSYSFASGAIGQQPWIAIAPVQIDKAAPALVEMRREIADYVTGKAPATEAELAKVKANNVRSLPGSYETAGGVLGQIDGMVTYHRPDDYAQNKPKIIGSVTLADLQSAASLIKPASLTWVVVGDLKKIEAPVRALDLGEVSVIDADGKPVTAKPAAPVEKK